MSAEKTQELQIIDPKEYGLEEVKANEMTSGLNSIIEERNALETIFNEVVLKELNADTLKEARELRLKIQKNRTQGIKTWHTTNKAFYLAGGRFVDAINNREVAINDRMESKLDEIENYFKKLEEDRLIKLKADRIALLEVYGDVNQYIDLKAMDDVAFNNLLADTKLAFETRRENERKAEEQRIADEKKAEQDKIESDKKAELERLEKEKADKLERERIEKENEELKAKEVIRQKRFNEMQPIAIVIRDFNGMIELPEDKYQKELADHKIGYQQHIEFKLEQENKEREIQEKNRLDELAKIKENAKIKAKENAEKELQEKEKERIELEEKERIAKVKAAELAPERDKVKVFFEKFEELRKSFPELTSEEGILLAKSVQESMMLVRGIIINESKKLL